MKLVLIITCFLQFAIHAVSQEPILTIKVIQSHYTENRRYSDGAFALAMDNPPTYTFTDYLMEYVVGRGQYKKKVLKDSLFATSENYLTKAWENKCQRIMVRIYRESADKNRYKEQIFYVNEMLAELRKRSR